MQIRGFEFKPSILLTLLVVCLFALLIFLGVWQLDRAKQKRHMMQAFRQRSEAAPMSLKLPVDRPEAWRYRHVTLSGRFDADHQFLLDDQVKQGRIGFDVLTPFEPDDGSRAVLVNRGWVPLKHSRGHLPNVGVVSTPVKLTGTVYVPYGKGFHIGGMDTGQQGWPRIIEYVDYKTMARRIGRSVAPLRIRLDQSSPYGYLRDWQVVTMKPIRHLGYAVQWFALAVTLIILYLVFSTRRVTR